MESVGSELAKVIGKRLTCFECNGNLRLNNDILVCKKCAKRYRLGRNSIDFDDLSFKTKYGKQFGEDAQNYEKLHSLDEGFSRGTALTFKKALDKYTTLPVKCALEIGCGTGVLSRGFNYHQIADFILATDISKEMIEVAIRQEISDNIIYLEQDASKLNIKNNSFDVVLGSAILHHLPELKTGLAEVFRVLAPKGVAVFMEPLYFGNQFIVFLIYLVIEYLKLQRKYSKKDIHLLEKTIKAYSDNLSFRYENRYSEESLQAFDDKFLFTQEDAWSLAQEIGFREGNILSLWDINPSNDQNVWKVMTIEVIEGLKREVGLNKLNPNYSDINFLDIIDNLLGRKLLSLIPPQGIVLFQK